MSLSFYDLKKGHDILELQQSAKQEINWLSQVFGTEETEDFDSLNEAYCDTPNNRYEGLRRETRADRLLASQTFSVSILHNLYQPVSKPNRSSQRRLNAEVRELQLKNSLRNDGEENKKNDDDFLSDFCLDGAKGENKPWTLGLFDFEGTNAYAYKNFWEGNISENIRREEAVMEYDVCFTLPLNLADLKDIFDARQLEEFCSITCLENRADVNEDEFVVLIGLAERLYTAENISPCHKYTWSLRPSPLERVDFGRLRAQLPICKNTFSEGILSLLTRISDLHVFYSI